MKYTKNISDKIADFFKEIFLYTLKILEAPFAWLIYFLFYFVASLILIWYFNDHIKLRNIENLPPIIQIYILVYIGTFAIISLLARFIPSLKSIIFEDALSDEFTHIIKYTTVPCLLFVILLVIVVYKWNPSRTLLDYWTILQVVMTIVFSILALIVILLKHIWCDISYSLFTSDKPGSQFTVLLAVFLFILSVFSNEIFH